MAQGWPATVFSNKEPIQPPENLKLMEMDGVMNKPSSSGVSILAGSPNREQIIDISVTESGNTLPTQATPDIEPKSNHPAWVDIAVKHLYSVLSANDWVALADGWLDLEAHLGYPVGKVST